jgi:hypothetical protein
VLAQRSRRYLFQISHTQRGEVQLQSFEVTAIAASLRAVSYAVGEFVHTQTAPDRTHVNWTYRFALKSGLSTEEKSRFRETFLERDHAEWMRSLLERGRSRAETMP